MTRAGVYGRNSKASEKSIEDQLKLGREVVAREGWTLAGEYSDDSSASRYRSKERDEWALLLADLAAGDLDILVLWKSARGSRDEIDWFLLLRACRERGVLIHVMADRRSYDPRMSRDWKTLAEDGVASAYFSEELSENVRRGVRQAAIDGGPHGRVAYGYDGRYHETTQRPLRVPNEHAPVVKELFDKLYRLTPISAVARDFREREVPSPSGGPWQRNTIRAIATNVTYIGKRRHDGELRDAQWPGLVDENVFWKVQQILGAKERKITRPGSAKYLLSYVATSPCGGLLQRMSPKPGRADRYGCGMDACVSIARAETDEVVERVIIARLRRPDARSLFARDDEQVKVALAEAARYRVQLEEARQSFESPDGISAEALARKERVLLPLIEDADRRSQASGASGALEILLNAADPAAAWAGLEMAARREVVKMLVHVVVGPPTRHLGRFATPEERLREAAVRLGGSTWVGNATPWSTTLPPAA